MNDVIFLKNSQERRQENTPNTPAQKKCISGKKTGRLSRSGHYFAGKESPPARRGSITVEAALAFSIFVMVIGGLLSLFGILNRQIKISYTLDRMAEAAADLESVVDSESLISNIDVGLLGSAVSTEDDEVYIALTYGEKVAFLPDNINLMLVSQQVCRRSWTGRTLEEVDSEQEDDIYVYVTEGGSVYHKSESCTYLNAVVMETSLDKISKLRNKDGHKYYPCPFCGGGSGTVYITPNGIRYHASATCSQLKRNYKRVLLSETNLPACSKCGGNTE